MALRFNWKKNLPKIIWGIILLILILCLVKIKVWEDNYYREKEGSTRAVAVANTNAPNGEQEVVEEVVTEDAKQAWKVAANKPRFLSIPKLGIDRARVMEIGVNNEGRLQTPINILGATTKNVHNQAKGEMIVGIPSGHEDEFVAYFKERGLNVEEVDING